MGVHERIQVFFDIPRGPGAHYTLIFTFSPFF
jgi:hypothetical protein